MNNCINSSKVYCKFLNLNLGEERFIVLIVAKCIVNAVFCDFKKGYAYVLIVAKCIVNFISFINLLILYVGINSSKVYCKSIK